jgi:hypothetical protein
VRDGIEYFYFDRDKLLTSGTTKSILKSKADLRLHNKGTSARNHGTEFRIHENDLDDEYNKIIKINF